MNEEPSTFELACYGCGNPLRAQASFCGRCGAIQKLPDDFSSVDSFRLAVMREAAAHSGHARDPNGTVRALFAYGAALALSLAAHLVGGATVAWDFGAQCALLVVAAGFLGARWSDHKAAFASPRWTVTGALLALLGLVVVLGLGALLSKWLALGEGALAATYRRSGFGLATLLLSTAVLPALSEEVLFRVVILGALGRAFQEKTAILVSALFFATLHVSPATFVAHSGLGVLFALVRLRSGSVYPSMVLHATYNAVILVSVW